MSNIDEKNHEKYLRLIITNLKKLNCLLRQENLLFTSNKPEDTLAFSDEKLKIINVIEDLYDHIKNHHHINNNLKNQLVNEQKITKKLSRLNKQYLDQEENVNRAILDMIIQKQQKIIKENSTYTRFGKVSLPEDILLIKHN